MKYIHNRNQFKNLERINEVLMDSENLEADFTNSLLGGTLNRLLGWIRSNAANPMPKLAKELDRLLAKLAMENIQLKAGNGDEEKGKDKINEVKKFYILNQINISIQYIMQKNYDLAIQHMVDKDQLKDVIGEDKANKLLDGVEKLKALGEGKKDQKTLPQSTSKGEEGIQKIKNNIEKSYVNIVKSNVWLSKDENKINTNYSKYKVGDEVFYITNKKDVQLSKVVSLDGLEPGKIQIKTFKGKQFAADFNRLFKGLNDVNINLIFDIDREINLENIKNRYRKLQKSSHPDLSGSDEVSKIINQIYDQILPIIVKNYIINNIKPKINDLQGLCLKCGVSTDKFGEINSTIEQILSRSGRQIFDQNDNYNNVINLLNEIAKDCTCEPNKKLDETINYLKESFELLSEKNETDEYIISLDKKEFEELVKEADKRVKEKKSQIKITEEEFNKMDDELKKAVETKQLIRDRKGKQGINGENAKALMKILNKAKNAMLHTKPYKEIRKKQKRWFDPLTTDETGRAVNRKYYNTWVKEVNEILVYYKNMVDPMVLTLVSDSLDKENIANDYVNLNKEFLGISKPKNGEPRGGGGKRTTDPNPPKHDMGTTDKEVGYVGVPSIEVNTLYSKISFVAQIVTYQGDKINITAIVTASKKRQGYFNFKFIKDFNIGWVKSYVSGKKVLDTPVEPNPAKNNNSDLETKKFGDSNDYDKVYYAQIDLPKNSSIKKGDTFEVRAVDFTDIVQNRLNQSGTEIEDKNIKVEEGRWTFNILGVLVGNSDKNTESIKYSEEQVSADTNGKDKIVPKSVFYEINDIVKGK
jgi:hypothetical protein